MTLIDFLIILIIASGAVWGFIRGFFKELASIVGLVAGFLIAKALYLWVAEKIAPVVADDSMSIAQVMAFIVIWVIVPIAFTLAASLFTHLLESISLGWLNRSFGLLLGIVRWVIIVSILLNVFDFLDAYCSFLKQTTKDESLLYYPLMDIIKTLFPVAREVTNEYLFR